MDRIVLVVVDWRRRFVVKERVWALLSCDGMEVLTRAHRWDGRGHVIGGEKGIARLPMRQQSTRALFTA